MSKPETDIQDFFEEKARDGDGTFAIAFAILELSAQQRSLALALDRIGFYNSSPGGPPGALEMIGIQLKDLVASFDRLTSNVERIADSS